MSPSMSKSSSALPSAVSLVLTCLATSRPRDASTAAIRLTAHALETKVEVLQSFRYLPERSPLVLTHAGSQDVSDRSSERHGLFPSVQEYARLFGMDSVRLARAKAELLLLAPGPINRGVEITPDVADGPNSAILEQVTNGLAVRMAVLYLLCGQPGEG